MKLTKETLKRIIKEELDATLNEMADVSEGNKRTKFRDGYRSFYQTSKGDWRTQHHVEDPETGEIRKTYSARGRLDPDFGAETPEVNVGDYSFIGERNAAGNVYQTSVFQTNDLGEMEFLHSLENVDLINDEDAREEYIRDPEAFLRKTNPNLFL